MYKYHNPMNISIIGTGYVGLVTGVCFAKLGHNVICADTDEEKVTKINNRIPPIFEEGLEELLSKHHDRIKATTDLKEALAHTSITFICVGTPSKDDGDIDLTAVQQVTKDIGNILREKTSWHLIVVKSTVLPGTTETRVKPLLEHHSGKKAGKEFGLAMNPEFLREGVAIQDFLNPDRIVIGTDDDRAELLLRELYQDFHCPIITGSIAAAEMIKYASNAFLATKISFINELGNLCKKLQIDTYEVADGMGLDTRIGRAFLDAGIGWGGSCFPKDIRALLCLARKNNEPFNILKSVVKVNEDQPLKLLDVLLRHVPTLEGKTIGILGLAFKPNTDDIRESSVIPLVKQLLKNGAHIKAYDPQAMPSFKMRYPTIEYCSSAEEVLKADAVIIATKWEEFKNLDFSENIVIDGRRLGEAKNAKIYEGVCW
jgi:UDPglucose 6-dehydrogenase